MRGYIRHNIMGKTTVCGETAEAAARCRGCPGSAPLKRQAELFFPPEFADDFPVAIQISERYGLVYVVTKLGLLVRRRVQKPCLAEDST